MQEAQDARVQPPALGAPLERAMATHSSILAWEILGAEEPGGLVCGVSKEMGITQ